MNKINKIFCIFLCFNFLFSSSFIASAGTLIEDEFVEKTLDKSLTIPKTNKTYYKDDFVLDSLNPNLKIKAQTKKQYADYFTRNMQTADLKIAPLKEFRYYDFSEKKEIEIPIRIKRHLSTGMFPQEGSKVSFETLRDIKINDVTYPKGTLVSARVETVSLNKSYGVPSDIVVGNFYIKDVVLQGEIKKTGANRSIWVYPCAYVGTVFFGLGLLLLPIRGGHAKIRPNEVYTVHTY